MKHGIYANTELLAPRRGAPLWLWVVAASFFQYLGFVVYVDFAGPYLGAFSGFTQGGMAVHIVDSHTPAELAGIQPGDRIIRADGQLVASDMDWIAILFNLEVDKPTNFEIQRGNQHLNVVVTPTRRPFTYTWGPLTVTPLMIALVRIGQLIMLGLACFVAFARPRNAAALLGALWLAGTSITNPPAILAGFSPIVRGWPGILQAPLLVAGMSRLLLGPVLFTLSATFPRRLIRAPWVWALLWSLPLVWLIAAERVLYRIQYNSHQALGLFPQWAWNAMNLARFAYTLAGPVVMVVNYRRLTDTNERRRVRVLVFGSVTAVAVGMPFSVLMAQPSLAGGRLGGIVLSVPGIVATIVAVFVVFPLSFVYPILRHRLFDVRIIIRQGVQYAMARRVLVSIVPLLAAILLADLFLHKDQSIGAMLQAHGWIYGFVGAAAVIVYRRRQQWLDQIDRRFFRDRFDAQRLLQEVIQRLKEAESLDTAVREVLNRIHEALHPEFVSLLYREAGEREFQSTASAPVDYGSLRLEADGKLISFLRVVAKPLQFSAWASLIDVLPAKETRILEEQHIELFVPIRLGADGAESLLTLGPKRSEEPYSREDQKLLSAIAASLALLSTRPATVEADEQTFTECPDCGTCFDAAESRCQRDGSGLVRVYMPRLLLKRYRLDRRIGRGGMGTVYSGSDRALDRSVAVKVIRPELVGNPDLIARFHQEARTAAGIVHPNVVTIHDFGVEHQHPFIIMELLSGRTLRTELDLGKRLSPERTLEVMNGVSGAVEEAHRRQLLHRDLKPENIFLAKTPMREVVKVLDFGLVKALSVSTLSNAPTAASTIGGTPYYMAPELLLGESASRASDVWALAVIAYEMLAGAHPFVTGNTVEWQKAVLTGRFTPLRVYFSDVSQQWQAFFERAFQRDPALRIGSAEVFQSELETTLRSQSSWSQTNR